MHKCHTYMVDAYRRLHEGPAVAEAKSRDHAALGAALREARKALGWTLEELGGAVSSGGMNPRYISAVERGEVNLSFGSLLRLSAALGVSIADLMGRYEQLASASR